MPYSYIDSLEYHIIPWYTGITAHIREKVTIEQYEKLYFFSVRCELSR